MEFMAHSFGADGFLPSVAALTGYDLLDRLEAIHDPTLVVWGRDDLVVPASDAAGFVERIKGARLEVFADCGHVPMAERPVRFNRLLAAFASEPLPHGGPGPAEIASD
jgi:pimeloyl-ACP methyl ester carboxylesterase